MRQSIEDAALSHHRQDSTESVNGTTNRGNGSRKTKDNSSSGVTYSFKLNPTSSPSPPLSANIGSGTATKSPMAKKLVKSATSSALLSTRHLQRNESISSVSSDASSDMTLDELEIIKTIGKCAG